MVVKFDEIGDIWNLKRGDIISASDRNVLFTGPGVGNTPQKGINWIGEPPNYNLVIARCDESSGYGDRWIDADANIFLYYLMVEMRGTTKSKINYASKENLALLNQEQHEAPVLLMINQDDEIVVEGYFKVETLCHDNPVHPGLDSVLLSRI